MFFYISTFWSMCAMPYMAVFSSLLMCFPGMLLWYFLNDFDIVPIAPIRTGITFVFTFYVHCILYVRYLYLKFISSFFVITFLSPESADMFVLCYHWLWCSVYCKGLFCQFWVVNSIKWLPYLHNLFLLILVHARVSVICLIFAYFSAYGKV